jgi:hypothetical protein
MKKRRKGSKERVGEQRKNVSEKRSEESWKRR